VTIRYANFETHTRQLRIPYTTLDPFLISKTKELFDKLYNRRMMLRLVGVKFSGLVSGYEQISLYETSEEQYRLCQAMDRVRHRFGTKAVKPASTLGIKL
jgi:DNA polymerase-4